MANRMNMPANREKLYRHILWMLRNMPNKEDNPFKWNRWLGFLQGVCFMDGLASIKQLKITNKEGLNFSFDVLKRGLEKEARKVFKFDFTDPASIPDSLPKRWEDISDDNSD